MVGYLALPSKNIRLSPPRTVRRREVIRILGEFKDIYFTSFHTPRSLKLLVHWYIYWLRRLFFSIVRGSGSFLGGGAWLSKNYTETILINNLEWGMLIEFFIRGVPGNFLFKKLKLIINKHTFIILFFLKAQKLFSVVWYL